MPIVLYDCKSIFGGISTTTVLAHPKADKPTTRDTRKIFNVRRLGNSIGASFCPKDDVDRPPHGVSAICSTKFIEYGHDERQFPAKERSPSSAPSLPPPPPAKNPTPHLPPPPP